MDSYVNSCVTPFVMWDVTQCALPGYAIISAKDVNGYATKSATRPRRSLGITAISDQVKIK